MFGDKYIVEIGSQTENVAKAALSIYLFGKYNVSCEPDGDRAGVKLVAAIVNRVFGEQPSNEDRRQYAAENKSLIDTSARQLSGDESLCQLLSGAAYNTGYARYVRAGGSRGINSFLGYVRCIGRNEPDVQANLAEKIQALGSNILAPIKAMTELGIMRPLAHRPNEREYYDAIARFYERAESKAATQRG